MESQFETKDRGLRGVPVANTSICLIKGELGKLFYRGYDIQDLATRSTFEEVSYLLLFDKMPSNKELEEFTAILASKRKLPNTVLDHMKRLPQQTSSMDVLICIIAMLAGYDPGLRDDSKEINSQRAAGLVAKTATIVATWGRIREGLPIIEPRVDLSHAANFLYMLSGEEPDPATARDFDICLILHAEHSFNASTFAARVVASSRAHIYAAVSAALGSLSGELHGGANTRVMESLLEIMEPKEAESWVKKKLDRGERIMGMGHAVYTTMDPRAEILRLMSERLAQRTEESRWFTLTQGIEKASRREFIQRKGRDLIPNVDLYSASIYYVMGIPPDLYTSIFAVSRIMGWCAHVLEEKFPNPPVKPMLYRPSSDYTGKFCGLVGCKYVPLEERQEGLNVYSSILNDGARS
ncbi:MAG: citrate/2-methylcitrate synthase [Candidatus Bathyarchaeota archaeon]|jgi:citrate synthase|nr:citrate/2-methylcitrate synthase [Candidatus Bathyarchaeota archaeon]MDP7442996.1 citrate/2-methylcitrate synthase [Candidatus Bathyarchaeota archaeon]|tara:strand:- start:2049 stop:3278 length:1230 start_codon:yes stop_codon:yes gene_type:complete